MAIRRAVRADLEALRALQRRCHHRSWERSGWEREFERPNGLIWVVDEPGAAGFAGYLVVWRVLKTLEVVDLVVSPDCRRRGVATALLEMLKSLGADSGTSRIALEVGENNRGAIEFYERCGFQRQGRLREFYDDGEGAIRMIFALLDS